MKNHKFVLSFILAFLLSSFSSALCAEAEVQSSMPQFKKIFRQLSNTRTAYNTINDSVFIVKDEKSWMSLILRRANLNYSNYLNNQKSIDEVTYYFLEPQKGKDATSGELKLRANIPNSAYDSLWTALDQNYQLIDPFMGEIFLGNILLPYVKDLPLNTEAKKARLAHMYLNYGDYLYQIFCMGDSSMLNISNQMLRKAIAIGKECKKGSEGYIYSIFATAHMLARPSVNDDSNLFDGEINKVYKDYLDDRSSFDKQMEKNKLWPHYENYVHLATNYHIMKLRELILNEDSNPEVLTPEIERRLAELQSDTLHLYSGTNLFIEEYHSNDMIMMARNGEIDYDEAFESCKNIYKTFLPVSSPQTFTRSFRCYVNSIQDMLYLMERSGIYNENEKQEMAILMTDNIMSLLTLRPDNQIDSNHTNLLLLVMRNKLLLQNLPIETRTAYLNRCFSVLSVTTLAHCNMVSDYSKTILDAVFEQCPEKLIGVMDYKSLDEVLAHKDDIYQLMKSACSMFDLGKLRMEQLINNEFRELTDHEVQITRLHVDYSLDIIKFDPRLESLAEFSLGHHRWYDGTSGYPLWYDNTKARDRILVDILTIADGLEAATNRMSRNYRKLKTYRELLLEFQEGAGTRYNPDVVNAMVNSKKYSSQLENEVQDSWQIIFRDLFREQTHMK